MNKNNYVTKRYSEGFKLKILSELGSGKYSKFDLVKRSGLTVSSKKSFSWSRYFYLPTWQGKTLPEPWGFQP